MSVTYQMFAPLMFFITKSLQLALDTQITEKVIILSQKVICITRCIDRGGLVVRTFQKYMM